MPRSLPHRFACNGTPHQCRAWRQIVAHSALRRFSAVHCRPKAPWALLAAMATPMGLELEAFITRSQLRKRCMDSQCAAGQGDAKVHSKTHWAPYNQSSAPLSGILPYNCPLFRQGSGSYARAHAHTHARMHARLDTYLICCGICVVIARYSYCPCLAAACRRHATLRRGTHTNIHTYQHEYASTGCATGAPGVAGPVRRTSSTN